MRAGILMGVGILAARLLLADPVCELDGKPINVNNAAEMEGKSGTVLCKDGDTGELRSQTQYRSGKRQGKELTRVPMAGRVEQFYEANQLQGSSREFDEAGNLIREDSFVAGRRQGAQKTFHPNGKLWNVSFDDESETVATFLPTGKPEWIRCDLRLLPLVPDLKSWCGLNGKPGTMKLYELGDALREIKGYLNGKLHGEQRLVFSNGKPEAIYMMKHEKKDGIEKRFSEKGNLLKELIWLDGVAKGERTYYLNGKPRMEKVAAKDNKTLLVREFYDDGKVRSSGSYVLPDVQDMSGLLGYEPNSRQADGIFSHYTESGRLDTEETFKEGILIKSRAFHKNGKLGVEEVYDDSRLASRKCYDPAGNLVGSEKYFEDGSRDTSNKPCPKGEDDEPQQVPVNRV